MAAIRLPGAGAPLSICWDRLGIPHVFAASVTDAYRGMGYAAGYARLWQIHLSTLYARGKAAEVLGERFVMQDTVHRAFDVPADRVGAPASPGDELASAYLEGLNAYVDGLDEVPPEFEHAGTEPRRFSLLDIASRHRFSAWFQHRTWLEKIFLGRLMATHGVDRWRNHVRRLSAEDEGMVDRLREPLRHLNVRAAGLLYPEYRVPVASGSNNWAVTGRLSASRRPVLATDPHQPFSIPNTFMYVHLHAPGLDVFGAGFPGVPSFMMGFNRRLAWGLTTACVDNYDVYVEAVDGETCRTPDGDRALERRAETVRIKGGRQSDVDVVSTRHGPLLEPLLETFGLSEPGLDGYRTAVRWELGHHRTSAGAFALLPLARTAAEFGDALFENDVAPLVNNIICVDRDDDLRRFVVAVLPKRTGYTGTVPLAGWDGDCDFESTRAADLLVEHNPPSGFALTANNDTMGERGDFPIHNFPASSARADRIRDLLTLQGDAFTVSDFCRMQLDLLDSRALDTLPELIEALRSSDLAGDDDVELAVELLSEWDAYADTDARGACVYYPLLDRAWHVRFMREVLEEPVMEMMPVAAPALSRWRVSDFLAPGSPWVAHRDRLTHVLADEARALIGDLRQELGNDPDKWAYGSLHQIQFWHTLRRHPPWQALTVGPDPIGGSATTLGMAMHMGGGPGRAAPGEVPMRVYHGPAFRLVVDLADPSQAKFVIAGGNSGRPGDPHVLDHYPAWLRGGYYDLRLDRDDIEVEATWQLIP